MVDIDALMRGLPVSSLKPACVALIDVLAADSGDGAANQSICLLEPPAGQHVPYIEPIDALEKLLRLQGVPIVEAHAHTSKAIVRLCNDMPDSRWVNYFDELDLHTPDCLPLPQFVAWLRRQQNETAPRSHARGREAPYTPPSAAEAVIVQEHVLAFLDQAGNVAAITPMFRGPDNWTSPWSLKTLPALPPPQAMIQFVPDAPWSLVHSEGRSTPDSAFMRWREAMRPVAAELEKTLGEPVYRFANLDSDTEDDDVHRFLVLHWCCTIAPESSFVRYLIKTCRARDVEELKAALLDPASYTQPFKMNSTLLGLDAEFCRITYVPADNHPDLSE